VSDQPDTIVHLVRHGEVENPRRVLYGRIPGFHLSADGRVQAKAAADFLAGRDVTVLRSSPLERALETAEPLSAEFGLAVIVDERLIEPWNHFEGMKFGVGDGSLPYAEVEARMRAALSDAADAAHGHEAVCVSHQLPIWVTRRSVEGRRLWHDPRRRQCALGSVTSFSFRAGQVTGVSYAEPAGAGRGQVAGA